MRKKIFVFFIISQLCVGCDFIYRILQKEGAQEKELIGDTLPFVYNERVEQIQKLLNLYGYHCGRADGKFGPKVRDAIAHFQEDRGLVVNRYVDRETWQALSLFSKLGLVENGELNFAFIQEILAKQGFDPGKIDGKIGPKTLRAIKAFQRDAGLVPDGKIGPKTLLELSYYCLGK